MTAAVLAAHHHPTGGGSGNGLLLVGSAVATFIFLKIKNRGKQ